MLLQAGLVSLAPGMCKHQRGFRFRVLSAPPFSPSILRESHEAFWNLPFFQELTAQFALRALSILRSLGLSTGLISELSLLCNSAPPFARKSASAKHNQRGRRFGLCLVDDPYTIRRGRPPHQRVSGGRAPPGCGRERTCLVRDRRSYAHIARHIGRMCSLARSSPHPDNQRPLHLWLVAPP